MKTNLKALDLYYKDEVTILKIYYNDMTPGFNLRYIEEWGSSKSKSSMEYHDILSWCQKNIKKILILENYNHARIKFLNEYDYTMFIIRWGASTHVQF